LLKIKQLKNVINKKCFVCQIEFPINQLELNSDVNLMVCNNCKGTKQEKDTVAELLDSLADGLVCGCI
jgi:hypothetical protein